MKKQISFSTIKLKDLQEVVNVSPLVNNSAFDKWFNFDYEISEEEHAFLSKLITKNQLRITTYSEEDLKMKFLGPLLNQVDFTFGDVTDWYEKPINNEINGVQISGVTDYLVATGIDEPKLPFFFIQEFKPSKSSGDPEYQLLAELLVALHLNNDQQMLGAYIIGRLWTFMLVVRKEEKFNYMQSAGFNSIRLDDLIAIYKTLMAIKADIEARTG